MRRKPRWLICIFFAATAAVSLFPRQASLLPESEPPQSSLVTKLKGQRSDIRGSFGSLQDSATTVLNDDNAGKMLKYDHAPFATYAYFGRSVEIADGGKAHVQQVLAEVQNGGIYDAALSAVSEHFGAEKTVIDIGGNFGAFSMAVKIKAPSVRLFTFEAIPTNCANLQANMHENTLDVDWTFSCEALGSADGETLTFSVDTEHSGGGSSAYDRPKDHPSLLKGRHSFFDVPSSRLDTLLDRYGIKHIDALKIDCEGCEYDVLKASSRIKDIDIIVAEFHINSHLRRKGHSFDNLKEFLKTQNPNIIIRSVDINMHEAR
mmetsp:Transcript_11218/g.46793  ORF Transcript_11218/g.46793 Transcript_11218/m.46793 type:complete len:319 (-) Transcript_11218:2757-3713(-)